MVQGGCAYALEEMKHAWLDTQMLIMQEIWTRGDLPQAMSSCLLEVLFLGDLGYRLAHQCQPQKQSILQSQRLARKLYGLLD